MNDKALDFEKIAEAATAMVKFAGEMEMSVEEMAHAASLANAELNRRYLDSLEEKPGQEKPEPKPDKPKPPVGETGPSETAS